MLSLGCQHSSDRSRLRAGYASLSRDNQCTYCLVPTPNFFSASKNWKNHCNGSGETREKVYNPANKKKKKKKFRDAVFGVPTRLVEGHGTHGGRGEIRPRPPWSLRAMP